MEHPNRIREIRETKGLTLEQVAMAAGTTNQQVSKLEKGERGLDLDWLRRIAQGLGCEPWELLPSSLSLPRDASDLVRAYASLTPEQKDLARRLVQELTRIRG